MCIRDRIVAADGTRALVGGQNQYNDDYLSINPAFDLTLRVSGPAAYDAQHFAQRLWEYVCSWNPSYSVYTASYIPGSGFGKRCATAFPVTRTGGAGSTAVFGVGRLGTGIAPSGDNPNQSEAAILGLLLAAVIAALVARTKIPTDRVDDRLLCEGLEMAPPPSLTGWVHDHCRAAPVVLTDAEEATVARLVAAVAWGFTAGRAVGGGERRIG